MTRDGHKQKYHCTECGHYMTEDSHRTKFDYDFSAHPYTVVVVE
jgi:hypothetical protein